MSDSSVLYRFPARLAAGLSVVAALSVAGAFQSYRLTALYHEAQPDNYTAGRALDRFAAVKAKLPAHAVVGYVTDLAPGGLQNSTAFRAAQYALAPALLTSPDPRVKFEWALGNFSKPQDFAAFGTARGLEVVQDFGQGVVLFRARRAGQ